MKPEALQVYVSPGTDHPLQLLPGATYQGDQVVEGRLCDPATGQEYAIRDAIPRFVAGANYADSFGLQWNKYRRIQLDSYNGTTMTRDRFFEGTGWRAEDLRGKRVLEAGCGAGRFSEVILATGAELYSIDYSAAVDAAWQNNQIHANWEIAQADVFALPFRAGWFDYVFCYGVLQHTPDPRRAFQSLTRYLKPGGQIAVDVYIKPPRIPRPSLNVWWNKPTLKYWYRPLTRRLPHRFLLKLLEFYIPFWMPVDSALQKIPKIGGVLASLVPCWNMSMLPLPPDQQTQWTILDTFDAFSCEYDFPQTIPDLRQWFEAAELSEISVRRGGNGILGNAKRA